MLRRLSPPPEPRWEELAPAQDDLPAVRVLFAPIGPKARKLAGEAASAVRRAASEEIREELAAAFDDRGQLVGTLSAEAGEVLFEMSGVTSRALIRAGILDWEGLGGPGEDDEAIAVSAETIEWFLNDDELRQAADRAYVLPDALRLAEKNASAGGRRGTSTEGTPATDTAKTPATPRKKAGAKSARTGSTSSKPTKPKPSGA